MITVGLYVKAKQLAEENDKANGKVLVAEMFNEKEYAVYLDDAAHLKRHGISDSNYIYKFSDKDIRAIMDLPNTNLMIITKELMEIVNNNLN